MAQENLINVLKLPALIMAAFGASLGWTSLILQSDLVLYMGLPLQIILLFLIGMRTERKFGLGIMVAGIVGGISSAVAAMTSSLVYWNFLPLYSTTSMGFYELMLDMFIDIAIGAAGSGVLGFVAGFAGGAVGRRSVEESEGRS